MTRSNSPRFTSAQPTDLEPRRVLAHRSAPTRLQLSCAFPREVRGPGIHKVRHSLFMVVAFGNDFREFLQGGESAFFSPFQWRWSLWVEVWSELWSDGICPSRITQPDAPQRFIVHCLNWSLPDPPPPKFNHTHKHPVWTTCQIQSRNRSVSSATLGQIQLEDLTPPNRDGAPPCTVEIFLDEVLRTTAKRHTVGGYTKAFRQSDSTARVTSGIG